MSQRLKILCLHGFTSNGAVHAHQLRRIVQALPEYDFIFPDGPFKVDIASQLDMTRPENKQWFDLVNNFSSSGHRAWYFARESSEGGTTKGEFIGLEKSLDLIGKLIKENGSIHAICGFSQGAGLAGILLALLQERHPRHTLRTFFPEGIPMPLTGVLFSGFKARFSQYDSIYDTGIDLPVMHVLGEGDSQVTSERSQAMIDICPKSSILHHGGGHNIPKQESDVLKIADFVRKHAIEQTSTLL